MKEQVVDSECLPPRKVPICTKSCLTVSILTKKLGAQQAAGNMKIGTWLGCMLMVTPCLSAVCHLRSEFFRWRSLAGHGRPWPELQTRTLWVALEPACLPLKVSSWFFWNVLKWNVLLKMDVFLEMTCLGLLVLGVFSFLPLESLILSQRIACGQGLLVFFFF